MLVQSELERPCEVPVKVEVEQTYDSSDHIISPPSHEELAVKIEPKEDVDLHGGTERENAAGEKSIPMEVDSDSENGVAVPSLSASMNAKNGGLDHTTMDSMSEGLSGIGIEALSGRAHVETGTLGNDGPLSPIIKVERVAAGKESSLSDYGRNSTKEEERKKPDMSLQKALSVKHNAIDDTSSLNAEKNERRIEPVEKDARNRMNGTAQKSLQQKTTTATVSSRSDSEQRIREAVKNVERLKPRSQGGSSLSAKSSTPPKDSRTHSKTLKKEIVALEHPSTSSSPPTSVSKRPKIKVRLTLFANMVLKQFFFPYFLIKKLKYFVIKS
ncbi:unnamed protein product [Strongylus vulgaris]|uniref:Uncharacterized protein n=1 Tax=Strongylus vulgaris TaxID=40348 RepID=A0A3P7IJS7_STRVU|nr:unnamed protein product [Strongylus vulgaris]